MTPIVSATILRTQSDARLVALVQQGYERAFEAIVERYRRPLQRYCRRMLSDSRSEDAVQQTFLKAWSALQAGEAVKDLKPWLYRIARNNSLDALKKAGYDYDELSDSLRATGTLVEDVERRAVMRQTLTGLAALPKRERDVLLGLAVEGKSRAQVAADLGISDGAVRQLAYRARLAMRAAATALTPLPLVNWAAAFARHDDHVRERIAELAAGGSAAGVTGALVKGGAVIVAAGVIATAPGAIKGGAGQRDSSNAQAAQRGGPGHDDRGQGFPGSSTSAVRSAIIGSGNQAPGSQTRKHPSTSGSGRTQAGDDKSRQSGDDHGGSGSGRGPGGGGDRLSGGGESSGSVSSDGHSGPGRGGDGHPDSGGGPGPSGTVPAGPEPDSSGKGPSAGDAPSVEPVDPVEVDSSGRGRPPGP